MKGGEETEMVDGVEKGWRKLRGGKAEGEDREFQG